jgi:acetolactate synthase-1/2/3 large subunit
LSSDIAARPDEPEPDQPEPAPVEKAANPDGAAARALLAQAQRPVILVGLGLEPERPYESLQGLAEAANAPVIVTPKAKGSLPDDHPLAAGTLGLTRTDPPYEILDEADCIVAVGFDVVELVKPWQMQTPLLWLAPWPNEGPAIAAAFEFTGPMQPVLQQLSDASFSTAAGWGRARVALYRQKLAGQPLPEPSPGRLLPQAVLAALRQALPRDTLVTTDVGSHKILTGLAWPAYTPNRYQVSNGLSAMGFGLPAAIAGSLVLNRPTVCITGDGGLAMTMGELGILTELRLPVITVVMNDSALDLIRSGQRRAGKPPFGTEFVNPDFSQIAAAYQLGFYRVTSQAECAEAVRSALAAGQPALIEAMIDPVSYPTTPGYVFGSGR